MNRTSRQTAAALAASLLLVLLVGPGRAQEPPASAPATQPADVPTSQPTTTQAAAEEKHEAEVRKELAEEQLERARHELETVRQVIDATSQPGVVPLLSEPPPELLQLQERIAQLKVTIGELRRAYADKQHALADRKIEVEAEQERLRARLATSVDLTSAERSTLATELDDRAAELRTAAAALLDQARTAREAPVMAFQQEQRALQERLNPDDPEHSAQARLRTALDLLLAAIDNQRLIAYVIADQAETEQRLADACRNAAEELRAYNRRFWIRHAYLLEILRILALALAAHVGLNVLTWLVGWAVAAGARALRRDHATPTIRRAQTLIHFARSIAKLLVWIVATVTVLAEFGVHPGQSAGALGVIGLVLAGMFQQLVIDFVKGLDIAIGGHYFVGDFIQAGGFSGHVLHFTVKYTVLRTPSGQVITLPNSQCVPSRRFPSGYVDNYVDLPLAAGADVAAARRALAAAGRLLNARVEAVRREPEAVDTFDDEGRTIVRVQVRVLPTCDWVVRDAYLPLVKRHLADAGVQLAGEPESFFANDIPTFRRLFSRQMTERELAETLAAESRPTIERPAAPEGDDGGD